MGEIRPKLTKSYVKVELNKLRQEPFSTIPDCLRHYVSVHPDRDAVVFASTDGSRQAVTWKKLYEKSCQVAKSLITLGVKRYELVAINIRNCPEWLYITFGSMIAGARPISISFTYKDGSDVLAMMEKLGTCSLAVIDPGTNGDNWSLFNSLLDEYDRDGSVRSTKMRYLRYLICHNCPDALHVKTLTELMSDEKLDVELPDIAPDDIATLFQTSGSTGVPKVVAHTHASMFILMEGLEDLQLKGVGSDDIMYNDRPFPWIGGFPLSILMGQTRVTHSGLCSLPKDRISFMIDVVKREKCTSLLALPPFIHEVIKRKEEMTEDWPVQTVITGGQPITKHLCECIGTVCEYFACCYGGTEFSAIVSANIVNNSEDFIDFSCGTPLKGEVKIVDEGGEIVPLNTRGEIYVRNKGLFKEYYNDPEKTKAVQTSDGWYKTDDMGRLTEDGVLYVEGRKSNMIISGGMNVAPEILETLIKSCPGLDSVVIVPVPDEILYQVLCACVIIKPGYDVTEKKIRTFCEESHNDKRKLFTVLPTYYLFLERFPETSTGKTFRKDLVAMATLKFRKE